MLQYHLGNFNQYSAGSTQSNLIQGKFNSIVRPRFSMTFQIWIGNYLDLRRYEVGGSTNRNILESRNLEKSHPNLD